MTVAAKKPRGGNWLTLRTACRAIALLAGLYKVGYALLHSGVHHGADCFGTMCYNNEAEMVLLLLSVFTAGVCYASLAIIFASKLPNTRCAVQQSFLNVLVDFEPTHALHSEHGMLFTLASLVHAAAHVARVSLQHISPEAWSTPAFRSGAAMLLTLLAIVPPMAVPTLRQKMSYGVRKALHFAFVPCMVAFCFHARPCAVFAAIFLGWYVVDAGWWLLFRTYLIEHPEFEPAGGGTSVRFALPKGYTFRPGQYIFVNVPWISRSEWHPFSIIPAAPRILSGDGNASEAGTIPTVANMHGGPGSGSAAADGTQYASFYAAAIGDWTQELFARSLSSVRRPIWISRAMPSPAESSVSFDRVLLVGTGVGVTPLLSMIERYQGLKQMHLLWACRDAHMLQHFSAQVARSVDTARIFYTGKCSQDFDWLNAELGGSRGHGAAGVPAAPGKHAPLRPSISAALEQKLAPSSGESSSMMMMKQKHIVTRPRRNTWSRASSGQTKDLDMFSGGCADTCSTSSSPDATPARRPDEPVAMARARAASAADIVVEEKKEPVLSEEKDCGGSSGVDSLGPLVEQGAKLIESANETRHFRGASSGGSSDASTGSQPPHMAEPPSKNSNKFTLPRMTSVTAARFFEAELLEDGAVPPEALEGGQARSVRVYETRPQLGEEVRRALLSSCSGLPDASWRDAGVFRSNNKLEQSVDRILSRSGGSQLSWWSVVYCGMSTTAAKDIRRACRELGVNFRHETFANW